MALTAFQRALQQLVHRDLELSARLVTAVESRRVIYAMCALLAHSGDGPIWGILGALGLAIGAPHDRTGILWTTGAVLLTALVVTAIKYTVRRPRPHGLESAKWSAMPKHDVYSFPSGHAARAVCIAWCVSALYPAACVPIVLWALGVGLARVAVGAHYGSDVIAGMMVGSLAGSLALALRFLFNW